MIRPVGMTDPLTAPHAGNGVRRTEGRGFSVPEEAPSAEAPAETSAVGALEAMLALQEAAAEPPAGARDRAARERGRQMLALLRKLQAALLGALGAPEPALLDDLAASLEGLPEAEDPELREAVAGVALRVRIELARWGRR